MGSEMRAEMRKFKKAIKKVAKHSSDRPKRNSWEEEVHQLLAGATPTSFQPV